MLAAVLLSAMAWSAAVAAPAPAAQGTATVAADGTAAAGTVCLKADDGAEEETGCSGCSGCSCTLDGEGTFADRIEAMIADMLFGWMSF